MNESIRQDVLDDINLKLQKEMETVAGQLSTNDYKVEIKVMGEFIHIRSEIQEGIDGIDPTDSEANRLLFNSWRTHIIKHIIKSFSDLKPVETERGVHLPSKNIMLYIGYNNVHNIDYFIEYHPYMLPLFFVESKEENKGSTLYKLSRLEFLEIRLNAYLANVSKGNDVIGIYYANPKADTITIEVRYQPNVNRDMIDRLINIMIELLLKQLIYYGWQEWVKIKLVEKSEDRIE